MKPLFTTLIGGLLLMGIASGCSRVEPARAQAAERSPEAAEDDERLRYVRASIEIACLSRQDVSARQMAARTLVVYRRHGYDQVMTYLSAVERYVKTPQVREAIERGIEACR